MKNRICGLGFFLAFLFLLPSVVFASTSVGENVSVGGTLGVTGISTLTGNVFVTGTLQSTGALTTYGAVTLGDATGDDITVNGYIASNVIPKTNNNYDLGAYAKAYNDVFASGTVYADTFYGGTLTATSTVAFNGNVTLGDATSDTITFTGRVASNILPSTDGAYDLGAYGNAWQSIYVSTTAFLQDIDVNGVAYTWPSSQGAASTYLKNDGSGTLTWATVSAGGTNDWGRFAENYGASALLTSSTYPVWFDGAVYVSSTLYATSTYLTSIAFPATNAAGSEGVITQDGYSLLHTFEPNPSSYNTFLGKIAGNFALTGGIYNTGIGGNALTALVNGSSNTAIGALSQGTGVTGGGNNSTLGASSMGYHSGDNNTCVGVSCLQTGSGDYNVAIGDYSGENVGAGSSNVFIGSGAGRYESGSNKLYIENSAISNPLIYGEFDNDYLHVFNNFGVGATSTNAMRGLFYVDSSGNVSASGTLRAIIAEDVGATCQLGDIRFDTGGVTKELCYCSAGDTWDCIDITTAGGPKD